MTDTNHLAAPISVQWRHRKWSTLIQCPQPFLDCCSAGALKSSSAWRSQHTLIIHFGTLGLSSILLDHLIQLTRWGAVNSSVPPFAQVSKTYDYRSDDTVTKSITYLWPRAFLCQVHLGIPFCPNMVFVMDKLWLTRKPNNKTPLRLRLSRPFLPVTGPQVTVFPYIL